MIFFKKTLLSLSILFFLIATIYLLGPVKEYDSVSNIKRTSLVFDISQIDSIINKRNKDLINLKKDNGSFINWADTGFQKTEYSLVYLHGFSASPVEGNPVHSVFATRYQMNLYVPLLPGHGLNDNESFINLTPIQLVEAAIEALKIGALIGEKVILMSCSTGGTLSLYLAANYPELISGLIMYSPNLELYDPKAKLLTKPWGEQILKTVQGEYRSIESFIGTESENYWTTTYRSEGLIALQSLIDQTMSDQILSNVDVPFFIGYYYKNDIKSDHTISIEKILSFDKLSSIDDSLKKVIAFPDVNAHVLISPLQSENVTAVQDSTFIFAEKVLGLKPGQ